MTISQRYFTIFCRTYGEEEITDGFLGRGLDQYNKTVQYGSSAHKSKSGDTNSAMIGSTGVSESATAYNEYIVATDKYERREGVTLRVRYTTTNGNDGYSTSKGSSTSPGGVWSDFDTRSNFQNSFAKTWSYPTTWSGTQMKHTSGTATTKSNADPAGTTTETATGSATPEAIGSALEVPSWWSARGSWIRGNSAPAGWAVARWYNGSPSGLAAVVGRWYSPFEEL